MNAALETITVLLVDDHDIVRQGLKTLLATDGGITVIAEARMNKLKIHNTAGLVRHAAAHDIIETFRGGVPECPDDSNGDASRHRGL